MMIIIIIIIITTIDHIAYNHHNDDDNNHHHSPSWTWLFVFFWFTSLFFPLIADVCPPKGAPFQRASHPASSSMAKSSSGNTSTWSKGCPRAKPAKNDSILQGLFYIPNPKQCMIIREIRLFRMDLELGCAFFELDFELYRYPVWLWKFQRLKGDLGPSSESSKGNQFGWILYNMLQRKVYHFLPSNLLLAQMEVTNNPWKGHE